MVMVVAVGGRAQMLSIGTETNEKDIIKCSRLVDSQMMKRQSIYWFD